MLARCAGKYRYSQSKLAKIGKRYLALGASITFAGLQNMETFVGLPSIS
jgi:hypothetical protein